MLGSPLWYLKAQLNHYIIKLEYIRLRQEPCVDYQEIPGILVTFTGVRGQGVLVLS